MTVTTQAVVAATGVTYRQLDYWARCGYVRPKHEGAGSGVWRRWSERELHVAELIGRLTRAGVVLEVAARVARLAIDGGPARLAVGEGVPVTLAPGVHLLVELRA
jgi:DNA-binding transcriptional MerR regulator